MDDFVPDGTNVSSLIVELCFTLIVLILAPLVAVMVKPPFLILKPLPEISMPEDAFGVRVIAPSVIIPFASSFKLLKVALDVPTGVSALFFSKFATTIVLAAIFEIVSVVLVSLFVVLFTVQFLNL